MYFKENDISKTNIGLVEDVKFSKVDSSFFSALCRAQRKKWYQKLDEALINELRRFDIPEKYLKNPMKYVKVIQAIMEAEGLVLVQEKEWLFHPASLCGGTFKHSIKIKQKDIESKEKLGGYW